MALSIPQMASALTVLLPLPSRDFDPTESAVPWKILTDAGHTVVFSTPDGLPAEADPIMVTGEGLGLLKGMLAAAPESAQTYRDMTESAAYQSPIPWNELRFEDYDALVLTGGHAQGMKEYLESTVLQNLVSQFFAARRPVGAICHGVVLAVRSKRADGKSVLYDKTTTALLETQELLAWKVTKLWMGNYYRTYDVTVEAEVKGSLRSPSQFEKGPLPLKRDTAESDKAGFVVRDGHYLSARWPGDAHKFANTFVAMLREVE